MPPSIVFVLTGIQCHLISVKFEFCNIYELKTYDTRKKISLIKFEGCSCLRMRAVIFSFHLFVCKIPSNSMELKPPS